jgi:hypothetical protein
MKNFTVEIVFLASIDACEYDAHRTKSGVFLPSRYDGLNAGQIDFSLIAL